MSHVLGDAGRAALKAFAAAFLVVAIGVTQQTNLNSAVAVGVAGIMAGIAAAIAAFQVFVPQLSFRAHLADPYGALADSFFHASVGAFLTSMLGILAEPNFSTWHALIIAAVVGALNAGLRAAQGVLTPGEKPATAKGISRKDSPDKVLSPA